MKVKGRHWLLLWLLLFLLVAVTVVARQTAAFRVARRLRELRDQRTALEARRADLERRIREASGRQVLVPKAERSLGLHLPADNEFILFTAPTGPATPKR
jgi:cell division protein FtsL